jgi:hypothetical protein
MRKNRTGRSWNDVKGEPDFEKAVGELLVLLSRRASHDVLLEKVEALYRLTLQARRRRG